MVRTDLHGELHLGKSAVEILQEFMRLVLQMTNVSSTFLIQLEGFKQEDPIVRISESILNRLARTSHGGEPIVALFVCTIASCI